jgi:hypothetical protein
MCRASGPVNPPGPRVWRPVLMFLPGGWRGCRVRAGVDVFDESGACGLPAEELLGRVARRGEIHAEEGDVLGSGQARPNVLPGRAILAYLCWAAIAPSSADGGLSKQCLPVSQDELLQRVRLQVNRRQVIAPQADPVQVITAARGIL